VSEQLQAISLAIVGLTVAVQAVVFALSDPFSAPGAVAAIGATIALVAFLGAWRGGSS
jgi:uncharacterized membrane protein